MTVVEVYGRPVITAKVLRLARMTTNTHLGGITKYWKQPSAIHHGDPSRVGVEYAVDTTADGYMLEIKLPWMSIMNKSATPDQLVGIDVWINDDDDGDTRDSQISWHSTDGNGWQKSSVWGVGKLVAGTRQLIPILPMVHFTRRHG